MSKLFRLLFFVVIGVLFLFYLHYAENDSLPNVLENLNLYAFTILATVAVGFGVGYINNWLNVQIPWRSNVLGGLWLVFL